MDMRVFVVMLVVGVVVAVGVYVWHMIRGDKEAKALAKRLVAAKAEAMKKAGDKFVEDFAAKVAEGEKAVKAEIEKGKMAVEAEKEKIKGDVKRAEVEVHVAGHEGEVK